MTMVLAEVIHLASTAAMVGVIWIVQLVHYPGFRYVEAAKFKEFSLFHQKMITFIVGPLMLLEFLSGLYLLPTSQLNFQVSMVMLILIWLSTFFFSVREHNILLSGKDDESITRLVKTNWIRTLLWSGRFILLLL